MVEAVQVAGRRARDDVAGGEGLAVGEGDAGGYAVLPGDGGDLGVAGDGARAGGDGGCEGGDDGIGTAFADHHAKGLPCHPLQIGKQRAAGDIGRKIKVHAPGTQQGANVNGFEVLCQELPGG